jgi:V8-like Glu-specific endopeptidase
VSTIWAEQPSTDGSSQALAAGVAAPSREPWDSPFAPFPARDDAGRAGREVIPPDDDRQLVSDTTAVPYRWICSLDVTFDRPYPRGRRGGFMRGSGLLVGPRHVLTAAHNIYPDGEKRPTSIYVAPGRTGRRDPFGRVKAVATSVASEAFGTGAIVRAHDYAIVTLEHDISSTRQDALGGRPLGHWGSQVLGQGTVLRVLRRDFLAGKPVTVCGYPGDRCGTERYDPNDHTCDKADQATTQWVHNGLASTPHGWTRLLRHTADTGRGQSGSPVWIRFRDNRRYLVGIHVAADAPVKSEVTHNVAVHLSDHVLATVRSWMP